MSDTLKVKITGVGAYVTHAGEKRPRLFRTDHEPTVDRKVAERLIADGVAVPAGSGKQPAAKSAPTGPPDIGQSTVEQIAEWIKASKPKVPDVIDLADGNELLAEKILEAETAASGGNPRQDVVDGLNAVIEPSSQGGGSVAKTAASPADYSGLKAKELKGLLDKRKIEYPKGVGVKNADLIALLEADDK